MKMVFQQNTKHFKSRKESLLFDWILIILLLILICKTIYWFRVSVLPHAAVRMIGRHFIKVRGTAVDVVWNWWQMGPGKPDVRQNEWDPTCEQLSACISDRGVLERKGRAKIYVLLYKRCCCERQIVCMCVGQSAKSVDIIAN